MIDAKGFIQETNNGSVETFKLQKRILSFHQWLELFLCTPAKMGRTAAQYIRDCFDYFGHYEVPGIGQRVRRFRIFDAPFDEGDEKLIGHEAAQLAFYDQLRRFSATGVTNRLVMMHGPNGSGKSSINALVFRALEHYSLQPEGQLYRFNWIFTERIDGKGSMGFGKVEAPRDTLAFVDENMISCKIVCELRENPLFLIPQAERVKLLDKLIADSPNDHVRKEVLHGDYLRQCGLSTKSKLIYDALMNAYHGDWTRVLRHIQVERYFVSLAYCVGAAVIVPQQSVDASSKSMSFDQGPSLPPVLQGLKLRDLYGELVDSCGGLLEFSDFLKRPIEMSKYLLSTVERGTVSLQGNIAFLNTVMTATVNEKYLSAFKSNPDFTSFKGRIELIRVPYLREWKKEREIYRDFIQEISGGKHVAPHTLDVAALWAVMTRLRRPDPAHYSDDLTGIIRRLTPLEKARLYGEGLVPEGLKTDQKKALLAAVEAMRTEHDEDVAEFEGFVCSAYEGRRGASAREVASLLADAAEDSAFPCLSPLAIFAAIRRLLRDRSVYDFLRLEPNEGYHDPEGFVEELTREYHRWVLAEIYDSMQLIEGEEFERRVDEYFRNIRAYVGGEKIANPRTGALEDPNLEVMEGLEKLIEINESEDTFRRNLMTKLAAYSLEHPQEKKLVYGEIFPDLIVRLRDSYYQEKKRPLQALARDVVVYGTEDDSIIQATNRPKVERTLATLRTKYGYTEASAKEAIAFVLKMMANGE